MVAIATGWQTDTTQAPPRHECPHTPQFSGSEAVSPQAPLLDALLLALVEEEALVDEDDALVDEDDALVDEALLVEEDELLDEALLVEEDELLDEALLALDEAAVVFDEPPVDAVPPLPPLPSITTFAPQATRHTIQALPTRIALRMSGC
jgi:hypothetical protein